MKWLIENKEWIFSGVGVFVFGLIISFFRSRKERKPTKMKIKSGSHSTNIQIGGDLNNGK